MEQQCRLGGWLAIVAALLYPMLFVTGIIQTVIAGRALGYSGPMVGPSDLLGLLFTAIAVYVLIVFRRFLNERYDFHGVDLLITLNIVWSIAMQLVSIGVEGAMLVLAVSKTAYVITSLALLGVFMLTIGVIDILIGARLMQSKTEFGELLRVFAVLTLIAGILEVSILLCPLAALLAPVKLVIMGLILLRDKAEAEFV